VCLLVTRLPLGSKAGERLKSVASTQDGFLLAELDLEARREGDVLGHSQSGRPITLRFLSLAQHLDVIESARELCESVYATDPNSAGMAVLAGQFTGSDRIDYLDKA
jgi:ATP-dependent DNA helicase RecG